jgi:hypothetical protein
MKMFGLALAVTVINIKMWGNVDRCLRNRY